MSDMTVKPMENHQNCFSVRECLRFIVTVSTKFNGLIVLSDCKVAPVLFGVPVIALRVFFSILLRLFKKYNLFLFLPVGHLTIVV
jgi:hypothetical protein